MIHASQELLDAMRGEAPGYSAQLVNACWVPGWEPGHLAYACVALRVEHRLSVTCPSCLRLMVLAQGARADVLQLREMAAQQARVEAEMERERAGVKSLTLPEWTRSAFR